MHVFLRRMVLGGCAVSLLVPLAVAANQATNFPVLRGLAPFSELLNTYAGRAALEQNFRITAAIQNGIAPQAGLQPWPSQQTQAIHDAFITGANGVELADGLGTTLGGTYQHLNSYTSSDDGKTTRIALLSPNVAELFHETAAITGADSSAAKYFFADARNVAGGVITAVAPEAAQILTQGHGTTDVYGKAYHHPAGSPGADLYGDSRPFQTEPSFSSFQGTDYFGVASSNIAYLRGPAQHAEDSPAFPSGHTTYGYSEALLLAICVPERYPQMITRAAEYGNSRIILGAHYAMDVIAGRTLAYYDLAHLLAGDTSISDVTANNVHHNAYADLVAATTRDVRTALERSCRNPMMICAIDDQSRFSDVKRNESVYEFTQTYNLPVVNPVTAHRHENVAKIAPEAGYLLTAAFPNLSLAQADEILTQTEGPGGGFLDNGSSFGLYSRLDLYRASQRVLRMLILNG